MLWHSVRIRFVIAEAEPYKPIKVVFIAVEEAIDTQCNKKSDVIRV